MTDFSCSTDTALDEGIDFALEQLCQFLGVDPTDISWDAATETTDGDIRSVIGNILRAKFGEDWGPNDAQPTQDGDKGEAVAFVPLTEGGRPQWAETFGADDGCYIDYPEKWKPLYAAPQPASNADPIGARISNWLADYSHDLMEDGDLDQEAAKLAEAAQWIADRIGGTAYTALDCDHLWRSAGGRGSGSAAVMTCEKCGVARKASDSPAWGSRLHYGPLDHFGPEDNDPGTAFIIHNVDDTVTIKVRSPGDRVFSEVEMTLDAWLKLRSVGGSDTSSLPSTQPLPAPNYRAVVRNWFELYLSEKRAIAADLGIAPQGKASDIEWSNHVLTTAKNNGELPRVAKAIADVLARRSTELPSTTSGDAAK